LWTRHLRAEKARSPRSRESGGKGKMARQPKVEENKKRRTEKLDKKNPYAPPRRESKLL